MNDLKFRKTLMTLIAVLVIGFNIHAMDKVSFVLDKQGKAFSLYLHNQVKKAIAIRIEDEAGVILWEENLQVTGDVAKKYNLTHLPDGRYYALVSDEIRTITQPLTIRKSRATIIGTERIVNFKPMVFQHEDKLDINWLTAGEEVSLKLFDQNGNVVMKQIFNEGTTLHKRLSLEQLPAGNYTLKLQTPKANYYREVICQ